jgi:type III restriction enzyme
VWFRGLNAVSKKVGIKTIYDLSATPFYLKGSGYNEGFIFPWVVSDFALMDAIESGIVKVPRIPVDDDASGRQVAYLHLWDNVGTKLPKRRPSAKKAAEPFEEWAIPETLEGALMSLYRSYEAAYNRWLETLEALGEPPPVFIVFCPNTAVSKLVFDMWPGSKCRSPMGRRRGCVRGKLPLFSNVDADRGTWLHRPNTIIVDSVQLESGDAMNADFKSAAQLCRR